MGEEKNKDGDAKAGAPKKKGLPALVLVALGAMVGGAGVVLAVPPKTVEVKVEEPKVEEIDVEHPDKLAFKFNPRTQAGKAFASVSFYFVYTVPADREKEAFEAIKSYWTRARSNVLMLLKSRTMADLTSEDGQRILTADLIKELDASLFPGRKGEKFARVSEVLWEDWILQ